MYMYSLISGIMFVLIILLTPCIGITMSTWHVCTYIYIFFGKDMRRLMHTYTHINIDIYVEVVEK